MDNTRIDGKDFVYITSIDPERDEFGRIIEKDPAPATINSKGIPKHEYGNGPFCKFRIPRQHSLLDKLEILGVYALVDEEGKVLYLGECSSYKSSTLTKRFNSGYG